MHLSVVLCSIFLFATTPFTAHVVRKDPIVALLCPLLLPARSCAQILGVAGGIVFASRAQVSTESEYHA